MTAAKRIAARHRRALWVSTALAAVLCAGLGIAPASAQSVTATGDVRPSVPSPPLPAWTVPGGGQLDVGAAAAGTLTIAGGGTVSNTHANIGSFAAGQGTVTVTGAGSTWTSNGSIYVGQYGTGVLTVENGGKVSNGNYSLDVGAFGSSTGTVTVTGSDGSGNASTLSSSSMLYVGEGGNGVLTVEDGGKVVAAGVSIGRYAGGVGTINLDGTNADGRGVLETRYVAKSVGTATLNLNGGILRATAGESNFLRNLGTLTVGAGGAWFDSNGHNITVGTTTTFAGTSSLDKIGLGTLTLTGDSSGFAGVVTVNGGTLQIAGGGKLGASTGRIGEAAGSDGTVVVTGAGSTWTTAEFLNHSSLAVGGSGTGTLTITDGGTVETGGTFTYVGRDGGSKGTVTVSGSGSSWTNDDMMYIGGNGDGTLTVSDGGKVSTFYGIVGFGAGSTGTASVSGAGSTWTNGGDLAIASHGTGTLTVENGGTVTSRSGIVGGFDATANGTVTVSGTDEHGHASAWTNTGSLTVGMQGTGTLTIADGGKVSASGVDLGDDATSNGMINIGAAAGEDAVAAGTLDVPTITFDAGNGTLVFNHTGATTFAAALTSSGSGTHALDHYAGTTTLTGDSSGFKGTTTVDGGTLEIAGGGKLGGADAYIGHAAGSDGTVVVTGAGSTWDTTGILYVGDEGKGTLTVEAGGTVTSHRTVIGDAYTGEGGVATVTGPGSTWTTGRIDVGFGITGTLTVADGGKVTSTDSDIGFAATGTATVTGAGSTWTSDYLAVGLFGNDGDGTLTVAAGGKVVAPTVLFGLNYGSAGTINIGAAAGEDAVAAGTLDATTLQFANGNGTLVFNHTGDLTFAAALTSTGYGTHALNHYAGTTTLTGDSSGFKGTTTVYGGTLLVGDSSGNGKLGGTVHVEAGGTLGGTGNLGSPGSTVTIAAGGVHAPGSSQSVLGDYINHGTLQIEAGPTAADKIVVAGGVDITSATLDLALSPVDAASWNVFNGPFTIIDKQSAGAVTGTFGSVTQNLLFLDAQFAYDGGDGNDVTLEMVRNDLDFAGVGHTRNQRATGAAVDALGNGNVLWRSIALNSDPDSVRESFDALSGEIHASARTALIDDSRFVRDAINDRIRAAFDGVGAAHAPVLAYGPGDTPVQVSPDHAGPVFWSYGFGSWGSIDSDGNAARLSHSTGGLLIGGDTSIFDTWRLGMMAGYSRTDFNVEDRASSGDSDNYHVGIYSGTEWGNLAFRTGLAYTWHRLDTRRSVDIPGFSDSPAAKYNGGTTQAFGEFGYGIATAGARFEPFANLAYVNLDTDDFAESGAAAALTGRSDTTGVTFTTLGLRAETGFSLWGTAATMRGMLGWRHAFGDTVPTATQAFAGSSAFTIAGVPIARDSALVEAGLDLDLSPSATLGLSYTGQLASDARDHGFKANLAIRF